MSKIVNALLFIFTFFLLFGCGTDFQKRKYTSGHYKPKRAHVTQKDHNVEQNQTKSEKKDREEDTQHKSLAKRKTQAKTIKPQQANSEANEDKHVISGDDSAGALNDEDNSSKHGQKTEQVKPPKKTKPAETKKTENYDSERSESDDQWKLWTFLFWFVGLNNLAPVILGTLGLVNGSLGFLIPALILALGSIVMTIICLVFTQAAISSGDSLVREVGKKITQGFMWVIGGIIILAVAAAIFLFVSYFYG